MFFKQQSSMEASFPGLSGWVWRCRHTVDSVVERGRSQVDASFPKERVMIFLSIIAGAVTGIVLGLFGSGGSIVTVPALMYLLHFGAKSSIAMGLGIVAVTAAISSLDNWRRGNVNLKTALLFASFGVFGTYGGTKLGIHAPVVLQLGLFALVMYTSALRMLKARSAGVSPVALPQGSSIVHSLPPNLLRVGGAGIVVGVLTGMVGVGGGFLIVPALVLLADIPMKQAVGTSLAIVTVNAATGFVGYLGHVPINFPIMAVFTVVAVASSFAGTHIAHRLSHEKLKRGFAIFLLVVATYIMVKEIIKIV